MKTLIAFLIILIIGLLSCESDSTEPAEQIKPIINKISPKIVKVGTVITITGENFGSKRGDSYVSFNGLVAKEYVSWSNLTIEVKVPEGADGGKIWVVVKDIKSNDDYYDIEIALAFGTVTDIDGNVYKTAKIGNQWWMIENLKVAHYRNGDAITKVEPPKKWYVYEGVWCYYKNDTVLGEKYGKLYNWEAVNDNRGLAPNGWRVPSDADWKELEDYLGGADVAGRKMKESGTDNWNVPNNVATNVSSFTGLPGGWADMEGTFYNLGGTGFWWSTTKHPNNNSAVAYQRSIYNRSGNVDRKASNIEACMSIRCIRN